VVPEDTPRFAGVCDRESGPAFTRLKQADQLIALGCVFSTGYRRLVTDSYDKMVHAANGKVRVGAGTPVDADIRALVSELNRLASSSPESASSGGKGRDEWPEHVETTTALTHEQLFREVEAVLDTSWVVVADTFLGIHAASDLKVKGRDAFLCNAVWASIGHSVAAAIGAALAAGRRPLVVCGDGGFQMTVQALSTMAHHRLNPVIVLVDNGLYGYEQYLIDRGYFDTATTQPEPYVTLNRWNYTAVAKALGFTSVFDVNTPATLRNALATAKNFAGPSLVAASVNPRDLPSQL
jgi:indolepyruvate decarboxylase